MTKNQVFNVIGPGTIEISATAKIGENVQFIFHKQAHLKIGDYCSIGTGVKFISSGGDFSIGDWTTLHDNCLVLSSEYTIIGSHCWFGQNSILDGTGGLRIGNGVRVGMYSQIWSHVAAGEQIEGCTLFGERPVEIEDDVWLVGSCIVASGVKIGRRTVALIGSNITKSSLENSVLAGSPAALKPNLSFYKDISLDEKWALLDIWLTELATEYSFVLEKPNSEKYIIRSDKYNGEVIFIKSASSFNIESERNSATLCCIENKKYTKRLTSLEGFVLKYLSGNKARFYC